MLAVVFFCLRYCPHNFTFGLEASLLGQVVIFRTISQPWTLLADILPAREGLFTKHVCLIFEVGIPLLWTRLSG